MAVRTLPAHPPPCRAAPRTLLCIPSLQIHPAMAMTRRQSAVVSSADVCPVASRRVSRCVCCFGGIGRAIGRPGWMLPYDPEYEMPVAERHSR
eukprot:2348702-Prymnesium_polylepis.3